MSSSKGVTARVAHSCEGHDRMTVNGMWMLSILPGHRYVRHVAFPGDDGFEEISRPWSVAECATCAMERTDDAALEFGICGSYCCGDQACVLPFANGAPGHDHACARCTEPRQEVPQWRTTTFGSR
jgi:hypothetical protein